MNAAGRGVFGLLSTLLSALFIGGLAAGCTQLKSDDDVDENISGRWTGLTSQGRLFAMDVFERGILESAINWEFDDGQTMMPNVVCVVSSVNVTTFSNPIPIGDDGAFQQGPFGGNPSTFVLSGKFADGRRANGMMMASYANTRVGQECTKSMTVTWQAEHVVCGDAIIEWPETCDDGNDTPGDGCSQVCQLAPTAESEPNDSPELAGVPFTTDVVVTGALVESTDRDLFAIRNPHPAPIAVALETHGQAPGVCDQLSGDLVDTVLEVLDDSGRRIAIDDDGSRIFNCSALSISVPAGATVFAAVSALAPTTSYMLHIRFQNR
jgi:cysteine-rich repeat protein